VSDQGGWGQQPGGQPPPQPGWGQQPPPPPPPQQGWGQQQQQPPPPPPPGQGYGAPPPQGYYGPPPSTTPTNGLAVGSLIAGIIAFFTGWIFIGILIGIAAVVMGFLAMKKPGGRGLAIGGIITGGLGIVFGLIIVAIVVFAADEVDDISDEFNDLSECLDEADTDSEIEDCNDEFFDN
jgi:hypothetical protein